jgi:hypothetical protein
MGITNQGMLISFKNNNFFNTIYGNREEAKRINCIVRLGRVLSRVTWGQRHTYSLSKVRLWYPVAQKYSWFDSKIAFRALNQGQTKQTTGIREPTRYKKTASFEAVFVPGADQIKKFDPDPVKNKSSSFQKSFKYPEPESNRHGFPQVFETSASTNSAIRA